MRRGRQPQTGWVRWRRSAIYAALIVIMLSVNYSLAHRATTVYTVTIPYSPFFLDQVTAGNVREITSKGTAIQGRFETAKSPERGVKPATLFSTEIPSFADLRGLSLLLQSHRVTVNAEPLVSNVPWWKTLLFCFVPTIL